MSNFCNRAPVVKLLGPEARALPGGRRGEALLAVLPGLGAGRRAALEAGAAAKAHGQRGPGGLRRCCIIDSYKHTDISLITSVIVIVLNTFHVYYL